MWLRELKMKSAIKTDKRKRAIDIQNSIRQILFRDWDPIGLNDDQNILDEYDAYIAPIYRILVGSRSEDEIINFLFSTEVNEIGISCESPKQLRLVAKKLLKLDVKI